MKQRIIDRLVELGIAYKLVEHQPVFTVEESRSVMPDKFPVRNLLLKEEKGERLIFVIMPGEERLDTKSLAKEIDCKKLQFAKPEVLMSSLGVTPGSASVFSLLHQGAKHVEVVIDRMLADKPALGFHPNLNTETIIISGANLQKFAASLDNKVTWAEL